MIGHIWKVKVCVYPQTETGYMIQMNAYNTDTMSDTHSLCVFR